MLTIGLIGRRVGGQFPKSYTDPIINSNNAMLYVHSFQVPTSEYQARK